MPTYHPVLEYYADGEYKQTACDDGQPRPLPPGMVCEIYYNPERPEEFQFAPDHTPLSEKIAGPLFIGIGIVILAVMVFVILLPMF